MEMAQVLWSPLYIFGLYIFGLSQIAEMWKMSKICRWKVLLFSDQQCHLFKHDCDFLVTIPCKNISTHTWCVGHSHVWFLDKNDPQWSLKLREHPIIVIKNTFWISYTLGNTIFKYLFNINSKTFLSGKFNFKVFFLLFYNHFQAYMSTKLGDVLQIV